MVVTWGGEQHYKGRYIPVVCRVVKYAKHVFSSIAQIAVKTRIAQKAAFVREKFVRNTSAACSACDMF